MYAGVRVPIFSFDMYNRWGEMPRSTPEERAMRYSAVCTSMLADRVEDLEEGNKGSSKRITEVKGSMGALEVQQAKLNDKVTLLEWDFTLNLKYCSQVIDSKAQMLSFGCQTFAFSPFKND